MLRLKLDGVVLVVQCFTRSGSGVFLTGTVQLITPLWLIRMLFLTDVLICALLSDPLYLYF